MPIYVYKCEKCEHVVEELRKMGDVEPPKTCNECKGRKMKRVVTSANFRIDPAAG